MARYDFTSTRLYVESDLASDGRIAIADGQANLLLNVLRLKAGDGLLVFNGRHGEWRAEIEETKKRAAILRLVEQARVQETGPDLDLCFAPLKHARLDYVVQKAVEMGAARLRPVITRRTQVSRLNLDRMRANVIEAAEQCGILSVAAVAEPIPLQRYLDKRDASRLLVFCDEASDVENPVEALQRGATAADGIDVLIGPEGGFAEEERALLLRQPKTVRLSLGPRILRADTAGVAALALVQAALGDWTG